MINFSSNEYNLVNFDAPKSPEQLIVSSPEKAVNAKTTRQSQLVQFRTMVDPRINVGVGAAGARMN